jgi:hypothetical protein
MVIGRANCPIFTDGGDGGRPETGYGGVKHASQDRHPGCRPKRIDDESRQKFARSFLEKTHKKGETPHLSREEFTAYGQACLYMARGIFQILQDHEAQIFASIIPGEADSLPDLGKREEYFRKDHVFYWSAIFI